MIDAVSENHHEYIDANLWFRDSKTYSLLILHNERGVFLQWRVDSPYGVQWFQICRHCGRLADQGSNYCCNPCSIEKIKQLISELPPRETGQ